MSCSLSARCSFWQILHFTIHSKKSKVGSFTHNIMDSKRSEVIMHYSGNGVIFPHFLSSSQRTQQECCLCDLSSILKSVAAEKSIKISSVRSLSALHGGAFSMWDSYSLQLCRNGNLERVAFSLSLLVHKILQPNFCVKQREWKHKEMPHPHSTA